MQNQIKIKTIQVWVGMAGRLGFPTKSHWVGTSLVDNDLPYIAHVVNKTCPNPTNVTYLDLEKNLR